MQEEVDYYLTLLLIEDSQIQVVGMTLEWIALALQDRKRIRMRISGQGLKQNPDHVLVQLELYDYVANMMDFEEKAPEDNQLEICDECADECVEGLVEFFDKSLLPVGLTKGFVLDCMEDREQASADLGEFLTHIGFGDEAAFTDVFVPLSDFKTLKKEDDFALYLN